MNLAMANYVGLDRYMTALRALNPGPAAQKPWYRIEAKSSDEASVYVYDEISMWGITADDFVRDVAGLDVGTINLHVNSPGGLVFDGIAIHNALRDHKAAVHVTVDGLAASIASVIAMAGDTVTMGRGTRMMVHNPHGLAMGEAKDMRQYADLLDMAAEDIAGFYAERAGGDVHSWRGVMDAETWYSAQGAVDAGLADKVSGAEDTNSEDASAAVQRFTFVNFKHPDPDVVLDITPAPSTQNRSRLVRARDRARHGGVST